MKRLELVNSERDELAFIKRHISPKARGESMLQILEAGCGREWPIDLGNIPYMLTGVDADKAALEYRKSVLKDLDVAIPGDLRQVDLGQNKYDVVYCSFVLEHIDGAEAVMDKFYTCLKPSGLLILRIPDRNSVYGFSTRLTPHWFHVFVYKHIFRIKNAGKEGFGPYRTFYDAVVSQNGMRRYAEKRALTIKGEYGSSYYLDNFGAMSFLARLYVRTLSLLSFGALAWEHNNLTYILEKPG
ncbi:MAG: class I SAM-dependent methyltransferase [Sulfobacillus sp.]